MGEKQFTGQTTVKIALKKKNSWENIVAEQ